MQLPKFSQSLLGRGNPAEGVESASKNAANGPVVSYAANLPKTGYGVNLAGVSAPDATTLPPRGKTDLLLSAVALHKQGMLDQAEVQYLDLLKDDPRHVDAMQYMGMLNGQRGQPEKAIEFFNQALAIAPQHFAALSNLGKTLMELRRYEQALTQLNLALEVRPEMAQIWHSSGDVLMQLKQKEQACVSYQRALDIDPELADVKIKLNIARRTIGNGTGWIDVPPSEYHAHQVDDGFFYVHKAAIVQCQFSMGKFYYVNGGSVFGGKYPVKVGAFCSFAANIYCFTYESHDIDHVTSSPLQVILGMDLKYPGCVEKPDGVNIGNDVYLGDGVRIMPGVRIGNGAVVGARSIVSRDLEPYGVYVGAPAKLVKKRFADDVIDALQEIKWWDWPLEKIALNTAFFNLNLKNSTPRQIFESIR